MYGDEQKVHIAEESNSGIMSKPGGLEPAINVLMVIVFYVYVMAYSNTFLRRQ